MRHLFLKCAIPNMASSLRLELRKTKSYLHVIYQRCCIISLEGIFCRILFELRLIAVVILFYISQGTRERNVPASELKHVLC